MIVLWGLVVIGVLALVFGYRIKKHFLAPRDRRKFELFVSKDRESRGYKVLVGRGTKDGGYDVLAVGYGKKYYISCKRYKGSVGVRVVRELYGVSVSMNGIAVIATTGRLTKEARMFCSRNKILINQY